MDPPPRAASVLSMDDLEAAQALEGLRSGMYLPCHKRYPSQSTPGDLALHERFNLDLHFSGFIAALIQLQICTVARPSPAAAWDQKEPD